MAELNCVVVTPEETFLDTKTAFVAVSLFDGEIGIAPQHSPLIGRLGFGEMRLGTGDNIQRYYVDGGFVQVADDVVSILTNRVLPVADLDAETIAEQLESVRSEPAKTVEMMEIRDRAVSQARAQLRLAQRS